MSAHVSVDELCVPPELGLIDAMKRLDETGYRVLLVVDDKRRLLGVLTDGDLRRYILRTGQLDGRLQDAYNPHPIFLTQANFSEARAKRVLLEHHIDVLPIVDDMGRVVDIVTWADLFGRDVPREVPPEERIHIPVVIMAGGRGTRLQPFTHVLPKPLIPVGEKPIVEHIMDHFHRYGVEQFYLTLNYKGEMIEAYFRGRRDLPYRVEFVWEEDFWGTAGSLKLLEDRIQDDFIVSNCDVIVRAHYGHVLRHHRERRAALTSLTSIQHHRIPYGVVHIREGGEITGLEEKPEYTFPINTGVYVINPRALAYIPERQAFDMTDLINALLRARQRVLAYPVSERDFVDVGQWDAYREAARKLSWLL